MPLDHLDIKTFLLYNHIDMKVKMTKGDQNRYQYPITVEFPPHTSSYGDLVKYEARNV